MAIKVQVTADNGIITEYHRIAMVKIDVNHQNTILIYSYLSESGRKIEKDYTAGLYKDVDIGLIKFPYVSAKYIHIPYDGDMSVASAYQYIKTLPEFSGAVDV